MTSYLPSEGGSAIILMRINIHQCCQLYINANYEYILYTFSPIKQYILNICSKGFLITYRQQIIYTKNNKCLDFILLLRDTCQRYQ
ncbi:hypothetical protein pb186bvf_016181 [Paramecium bursaria]